MSKTLFKVFSTAYLRDKANSSLIEDCYTAISKRVEQLMGKVTAELEIIQEIASEKPFMSVIMEEETDREEGVENVEIFEERVAFTKKIFNAKIGELESVESNFEQLVMMYKQELKSIAESLTEIKSKNKKLKQECESKQKYIEELKEVKTELEEAEHIRKAPEPVSIKCMGCINKENIKKNQGVVQITEKEDLDDKKKWRNLSIKIDTLKKKIDNSETEINQKNKTIIELEAKLQEKNSIKQNKQNNEYNESIRSLKSTNTTLRGEKITLESKLSHYRKELSGKEEICELQNVEIEKMKIEIDNLSSTVKWQMNTIKDMKDNMHTTINNTMRNSEHNTKKHELTVEEYRRENEQLIVIINSQEEYLSMINSTLEELEASTGGELVRLKRKIYELQNVLDEKNECIVRLKTMSKSDNMAYYNDLIRVLTRKIGDRDQVISNMQQVGN